MTPLRRLLSRWRTGAQRAERERRLAEELATHLAMHTEENVHAGMSVQEARRQALLASGGLQVAADAYWDHRRLPLVDGTVQDLRYGLRMIRRAPGFAALVVLVLAVGIGATAAVFSLIQGVLLTPPPYDTPDRLVLLPSVRTDGQQMARPRGWPSAQWTDWRQQATAFTAIAGYAWAFNFFVDEQGSESMEGMVVTPDYFRVVGLQPILGRAFDSADATGTRQPVVIIGYDLWRRKFNSDPGVIGRTLRMSRQNTPPTIVGVMPPDVRFLPSPSSAQEPNYDVNGLVDFWITAIPAPDRSKQPIWDVVGRLKDGSTLAQVQSELTILTARQAQSDHDFDGFNPRVEALSVSMNRDGRRILLPLLGAAALVLLIACGNAAALLLVRGLQRQREYAVRSALGVGRLTLFRQVSMESLLLALAGGACGVGLALGIVRSLKLVGGHAIPRLAAVTVGWPALACGFGAAIFAALVAGTLPAFRASRIDPLHVMKSTGPNSSAGRGERRLLRGVTVAQTALTLALLVGAGLLIRTMANVANVQSGYNTERIVTMTVTAVKGDWAEFHTRALERVSALPGVQHAAFAWGVPLTGNSWGGAVELEGQPPAAKPSDRVSLPVRAVTPGYFAMLGQTIADGRDFRSTDGRGAPAVAVVNRALADRYFPGASPIGRKIWSRGRSGPPTDVIGVVSNSRTDDLTQAAAPEMYLSLWQAAAYSKDLVIRTAGDPRSVMASVERELRGVDPTVAVENVRTLADVRSTSLAPRMFAMQLLAGFSAVGTLLTLVGIYGVLSLSVAARRREIAIRIAVGAERQDIRSLVLAEGVRLIAAGVLAGSALALVSSRALQSFLFDVEPTDPVTLVTSIVLFAAVALLACWVPTSRAARVDALEALRCE